MKRYQRLLLVLYPITVFLGSLVHTFAPLPDSVFSNKRNALNQIFAKRGWAWTGTLLLMFILICSPASRRLHAAGRWALATLYWVVFAQWAFGHSVFDRVLTISGTCSIDGHGHPRVCKQNGGEWMGFDVSGHCFLLIHMSLFIWEELQLLAASQTIPASPIVVPRSSKSVPRASVPATKAPMLPHPILTAVLSTFLIFLFMLWYTMLIATSVYFHSWQEKVAGTCAGMAYWLVAYVVTFPKAFPEMMPANHLRAE